MKRDILNYLGEKIGELELPIETTESQWSDALAPYCRAQPAVQIAEVTPRQIRQALVLSGITTQQIEDVLNALPQPAQSLARIEWEYSVAFQRRRPLVAQVASALGWTDEQIDALWLLAGSL